MKIVHIYCEGKKGSHDYDLLEETFKGLKTGWHLKPIGGKKGAKSAIQVYENKVAKASFKLFFRDRDFDRPIPSTESLTQDGYIYYSYRTTIENYLLDEDTFINFLKKGYPEKLLNQTNQAVRASFLQAVTSLKYHQAMRHTLGKMRIPTDFDTNIQNNKSGTLPQDLSQAYCQQKGKEQVKQGREAAKDWTNVKFDELFNDYITKFDATFFAQKEYLNWFQGKDIAKALSRQFPGISMSDYYKYAKKQFNYTQFADLVQLRQLVDANL